MVHVGVSHTHECAHTQCIWPTSGPANTVSLRSLQLTQLSSKTRRIYVLSWIWVSYSSGVRYWQAGQYFTRVMRAGCKVRSRQEVLLGHIHVHTQTQAQAHTHNDTLLCETRARYCSNIIKRQSSMSVLILGQKKSLMTWRFKQNEIPDETMMAVKTNENCLHTYWSCPFCLLVMLPTEYVQ